MSDPPCEKCGGSGYVAVVLPGESTSTVIPCEACRPAAYRRKMKAAAKREEAPPQAGGVSPLVAVTLTTEACLAAMKLADSGSMLNPRSIAAEAVRYAQIQLKAEVGGDLREHVTRGITGVTQAYLKATREG